VVVSAVAGLAGVGKTALTIHAGPAARTTGWFPGGVLFIDLHGYDQAPVQPGQALDALLRAVGVPGEHIPDGTEQRAGLYRSVLAQVSGPVLIIADNASAEAQVRPLLPGPGPHRMIVTSRHTLAGLGARLLDVTVLNRAAAVALLDRVLRAGRPGDDRISGDPAAGRLGEACEGLPLALQITAALLVADPCAVPELA
jgi:predicted ATPase